ncbi:MAG: hypothetical protein JWM04_1894 [Verrucomicrobiales bacterium]|nr:hypothetical protein [Verrucomicrobiales bacterium]
MEAFFLEVGKSIGREPNGGNLAKWFKKFGAWLSYGGNIAVLASSGLILGGPAIPPMLVSLIKFFNQAAKNARSLNKDIEEITTASLEDMQKELTKALQEFGRPLLIIFDDLDRLTPEQLLTIFQIVKQNANLPGVNYLLLMDRSTAEKKLLEKQIGPEFIEKIAQFELNLPHPGKQILKELLRLGFIEAVKPFDSKIDWARWETAWEIGFENLFSTLRRIKRFLHTLEFHVKIFVNNDVLEVDPVELFLIEIVRKFCPVLYEQLPRLFHKIVFVESLTLTLIFDRQQAGDQFGIPELNQALDFGPQNIRSEVRRLLRFMFPQIGRGEHFNADKQLELMTGLRICHEMYFETYFRLTIADGYLSQMEINEVLKALDIREDLKSKLMELCQKVGLREILVAIQCHSNRIPSNVVSNLLSAIWEIDEQNAIDGGIEKRNGEMRGSTESISRFLLLKNCAKAKRKEVALEAMKSSGTIYIFARMVHAEIQMLKREPHHSGVAFDASEHNDLKLIILKRILEIAEDGRLLESPDSYLLVNVWSFLDSLDAPRNWLMKEIESPKKVGYVLSRFIGKVTENGVKEHYFIARAELKKFFDLDILEQKLKEINASLLPLWEEFAVIEARKRLKEGTQGIEEAIYEEN